MLTEWLRSHACKVQSSDYFIILSSIPLTYVRHLNFLLLSVVRDEEPLMETYEAERLVSENLIQLEEDFQRLSVSQDKPAAKPVDLEPADDSPIYFR